MVAAVVVVVAVVVMVRGNFDCNDNKIKCLFDN